MITNRLLGVGDLTADDVSAIFEVADTLRKAPADRCEQLLVGTVVATVFFQPSTRTRIGFELSAARLGAKTIGFGDVAATRSTISTGETFEDTIRVLDEFADILVIRHFVCGASDRAAALCSASVINAGDGTNEHPSQALADAWLMARNLGGLSGTTIGLVGDPESRVLRSLTVLLAKLGVGKLAFLIPPKRDAGLDGPTEATLPADLRTTLDLAGVEYDFAADICELLVEADAIEMMPYRIPPLDAEPHTLSKPPAAVTPEPFRLTARKLQSTNSKTLVLHPGPRCDELAPDTDEMANSLYFRQVREATFMRMAVLACFGGRSVLPHIGGRTS